MCGPLSAPFRGIKAGCFQWRAGAEGEGSALPVLVHSDNLSLEIW